MLCLGAWCKTYARAEEWDKLNAEIAPYHWDDREKLHRDYFYLRGLHEVLLIELTDVLNSFHRTQHSSRYWRILIGPWLLYFTQMLFDRWEMVQYAIENYKIDSSLILDFSPEKFIPHDMVDFRNMYSTDTWNHIIYGQILTRWTSVTSERVKSDDFSSKPTATSLVGLRKYVSMLRNTVTLGVSRCSQFLSRSTDVFFFLTYLPLKQDFLLQLALGQVPSLNLQTSAPRVPPDFDIRKTLSLSTKKHECFEQYIRTSIPEHIPTVYLEGYEALQDVVAKMPWPNKTKSIFTSVGYNADDVFKAWAGLKVEDGTPLVIGQHGGNLGSALWTSSEDHEVAIADRYLTWGWSDDNPTKYPVRALKQIGKSQGVWNPTGHLLLVSSVMPRYSYVMGSFTVAAAQIDSYLEDQYKFVRELNEIIHDKLVVRVYTVDWGWDQVDRWQDEFPSVHIDSGNGSIESLVNGCRLYVATYNATTFLESLSRNIPTIMFWNPKHWELRSSANIYFEKLKNAGIFHESPESAAKKIIEIWDDVQQWWDEPEVQEAREYFCNRFAKIQEKPIENLRKAISTVVSEEQD